ncbi:PucR family transcriptional regulator [Microbacterium sp. 2MCAF23]|uniref:PucR family transcriptional regulator n=1 Tax=Microbacterium sp. 2MCAF23 TaxID=3232985 RepID=UPI003F97ADA1
MSPADDAVTVTDLLDAFAGEFHLRPLGIWPQSRPISNIVLFREIAEENVTVSTLVLAGARDIADLRLAAASWSDAFPTVLIAGVDAVPFNGNMPSAPPVISAPTDFSAARFIAAFSRWLDPAEIATARKLAAIQSRFNLALAHVDPVQDLFRRVSRQLGGTVALVDDAGRIHSSSGPLPMSQVGQVLDNNAAPVVRIDTEKWRGAAIRVRLGSAPGASAAGWLIGLVPAPHRFENTQVAALQLAAPLFDTILMLRSATQEHQYAVDSALLAEALAFRPLRHDADLQGKLLGSGISFTEDLHVATLQPRTSHLPTLRRRVKQLVPELKQALDATGIRSLVTEQDQHLVALVQTNVGELRRVLTAAGGGLGDARVGVGRAVRYAADIASSYQDGILALRIDAVSLSPRAFAAAMNFDYAFRLFSEIGLERMLEWARSFFAPLLERDTLLSGLQAYFAFDQNMNAAAEALGIHHNSLRYRIAKAEEGLGVSLRSPSAIASVFLAITALELGHELRPFSARNSSDHIATGDAIASPGLDRRASVAPSASGVVVSGEG